MSQKNEKVSQKTSLTYIFVQFGGGFAFPILNGEVSNYLVVWGLLLVDKMVGTCLKRVDREDIHRFKGK